MPEQADILRLNLQLGQRSYPIVIGSGILDDLGEELRQVLHRMSSALVVADTNTAGLYADRVVTALRAGGWPTASVTVPSGEQAKRLEQARELYSALYRLQADRRSAVVAVGGGVVGDLAGFVAATYARGISFVQVPTTLLAQVDASVGGKTAVNFEAPDGLVIKNLIGAFHQPSLVYVDVGTLATLPEREYRAGLAEVVKYGVILDETFFQFLERRWRELLERDHVVLIPVIARCCEIKAEVVQADEREETGFRAVLNLGHTFAHAIEALTSEYLHGEAVAIGMVAAAWTAELLGLAESEVRNRVVTVLERLGLPTSFPRLDADRLIEAMRHDKKAVSGRLRLVLPLRIGEVQLVKDVSEEVVREAVQRAQGEGAK